MRRVYTTGQIAKICQVAPRTVSKWIDLGKMKGFRIPGSNDRRVPHERLVEFLSANGMTDLLDKVMSQDRIALALTSDHLTEWVRQMYGGDCAVQHLVDLFQAGLELHSVPSVAVLDRNSIEWGTAVRMVNYLTARGVCVIVLTREDSDRDEWADYQAVHTVQHPVNLSSLGNIIDVAVGRSLPRGAVRHDEDDELPKGELMSTRVRANTEWVGRQQPRPKPPSDTDQPHNEEKSNVG